MQEIQSIAVEAPHLNIAHSIPACRETPKVPTSMLGVGRSMLDVQSTESVGLPPSFVIQPIRTWFF